MVAPAIVGGIIAAGGALGGAGIGASGSKKVARMNIKYQKKFAQNALQWRVQDARKAGLHPLAALGAQLPSFTPVYDNSGEQWGNAVRDLGAIGQDVTRSATAQQTPEQQQLTRLTLAQAQANLEKTYAEKNYIDQAIRDSQQARLRQINDIISQPIPDYNTREKGGGGTYFGGQAMPTSQAIPPDYITPKAADQLSEGRGTNMVAGLPAGWRMFKHPSGLRVAYPTSGTDLAEAKESVFESMPNMLEWYSVNARLNPNFAWDLAHEWGPPDFMSGLHRAREYFNEGWRGFGKRVPRYDYAK